MAFEDGTEIPDVVVERRKNGSAQNATVIDLAGIIPPGDMTDQLADMLATQVQAHFGRRALRPPNTEQLNERIARHVRRQLRDLKRSGDIVKRPDGQWRLALKLRRAYRRATEEIE